MKFRAEAIGEFLDFEPALREASARFRRRVAAGGRGDRTLTDAAIVLRELTTLHEHAERLRRRRPARAEDLRHDIDLQDALSMSLLVAVQAALDVALHIASDEGLGVPATYAEGFRMLADHGVIDQETSSRLGAMAALRNRIAHGYASVDFERIWTELPAGLDALAAFASAVARRLGNQG
ncbi:MAG: DUF86 domain-containing protein [Planctomycetota bacterium]|nr:DUF86 domain-containing protein [Planctomycetota bacterium]